MNKVFYPSIHLHIWRSELTDKLVHWQLARSWWEGDTVPREGRRSRRVVLDEGSFAQPEPIRDIAVLVSEIAATIEMHAHGVAPSKQHGARERSGIENIPLPLDLPPADPAAQEPTDSQDSQ